MNKTITVLLFVLATSTFAGDEGKADIRYAGLGRYTCSGDKYKCAQKRSKTL